jgi:hypothetical protein
VAAAEKRGEHGEQVARPQPSASAYLTLHRRQLSSFAPALEPELLQPPSSIGRARVEYRFDAFARLRLRVTGTAAMVTITTINMVAMVPLDRQQSSSTWALQRPAGRARAGRRAPLGYGLLGCSPRWRGLETSGALHIVQSRARTSWARHRARKRAPTTRGTVCDPVMYPGHVPVEPAQEPAQSSIPSNLARDLAAKLLAGGTAIALSEIELGLRYRSDVSIALVSFNRTALAGALCTRVRLQQVLQVNRHVTCNLYGNTTPP